MKDYGYLRGIVASFHSRTLYRQVLSSWGNSVFTYALILALIGSLISSIGTHFYLSKKVFPLITVIADQAPLLTLENGTLKTPENRPYIIKAPNAKQEEEVFVIIDTSGKYTTLQDSSAHILITKSQFIHQSNADKSHHTFTAYEIPKSFNGVYGPDQIRAYSDEYINFAWMALLPFSIVLNFVFWILKAFVVAIIGKIGARIASFPLSFSKIFRLAMVAITPGMVIKFVVDVIGASFLFEGLVALCINLAYLLFAMSANKKNPR